MQIVAQMIFYQILEGHSELLGSAWNLEQQKTIHLLCSWYNQLDIGWLMEKGVTFCIKPCKVCLVQLDFLFPETCEASLVSAACNSLNIASWCECFCKLEVPYVFGLLPPCDKVASQWLQIALLLSATLIVKWFHSGLWKPFVAGARDKRTHRLDQWELPAQVYITS